MKTRNGSRTNKSRRLVRESTCALLALAVLSLFLPGSASAVTPPTVNPAVQKPHFVPPAGELPYSWHDFNGDSWPDLVAHQNSTGNIYVYPFSGALNGTHTLNAPVLVIPGASEVNWIGVGEFTGDFNPDLVVRLTDGTLWVYPGTGSALGTGSFSAPIEIGRGGWNSLTALAVGDVDASGYDGIIARQSSGNLVYYTNTGIFDGLNTLTSPDTIGTGWNTMKWISAGDVASDSETGFTDLVPIRSDGNAYLYSFSGTFNGTSTYNPALQVGQGFTTVTPLALVDVTADNFTDIIATNAAGQLLEYGYVGGFSGLNTFKAPVVIGSSGWNAFSIVA